MRARSATMGDSGFLLQIKNDPITRSFSVVTHDKIKKEDHEKWLAQHLDEIKIIEDLKVLVGMFRVDTDREVSINLHPDFRGMGYGSKILRTYCPKGVWAKIVNGNVASMRIFLANGFKIIGYEQNYYVLKN